MTIKSNSQAGRGMVSGAMAAGLMSAAFAMGCARSTIMEGEDVTCGEGTVLQDDECVVDGSTGGGSSGPGGAVSCTEGTMQPCYTGPAGTEGVGVCKAGTQTCVGGSFGACEAQATPSSEACDGLDNNCDGAVDVDCGSIGAASYTTDPGYFDAVLDTERHQVFLSYGGSGVVRVVSLADGSDKVVTTGFKAEHMHFDPSLDQVAITLPSGDHSAYWWDEEQEGYVGAIDAISLADPKPIWIPMDPWQIVSDGSGNVYASGASGQWTSAITVNLTSGWATKAGSVYQGMVMELHPALNRVYAADTGLSPSDIERWDITNGAITPSYDSPYHGDYPMCGDLRIHPSGNTIYTKCGHIFLASNVKETDMTWVADMGIGWDDLVFHPAGDAVYVITEDAPTIYEYNAASLMPVATHPLSAPAQRILAGPTYLVVVRGVLGGDPKTQVEVIPYAEL